MNVYDAANDRRGFWRLKQPDRQRSLASELLTQAAQMESDLGVEIARHR